MIHLLKERSGKDITTYCGLLPKNGIASAWYDMTTCPTCREHIPKEPPCDPSPSTTPSRSTPEHPGPFASTS